MKDSNSSPMRRPLSASDAPKIAAVLAVALLLTGAAWQMNSRAKAQGERQRTIKQMKLEMGVLNAEDQDLSPSEADEAQSKRQDEDPNFQA